MKQNTMKITQLPYPVPSKRKYSVIHNGKQYTCYLQSFSYDIVVTGDGNSTDSKIITDTQLGRRIVLECLKHR